LAFVANAQKLNKPKLGAGIEERGFYLFARILTHGQTNARILSNLMRPRKTKTQVRMYYEK
jgi:hypothetical protein